MPWKPYVTVAAVIEKDGRFLLVEETTDNGLMFNQPAGHLEPGEDLISAVKREVKEETAWRFEPETVVAVQLWRKTPDSPSFLRFCFTGSIDGYDPGQALDDGIIETHWLSHEEIVSRRPQLRSPLVLKTLEAYLSGQRYPLNILQSYLDIA